ncbi:MAG: hypothetical protein ACJAZX_001174 [Rickettsiales bacterium]|jgi:hypothetical protein
MKSGQKIINLENNFSKESSIFYSKKKILSKYFCNIFFLIAIFAINSCSWGNEKFVPISFDSDPSGAKIYINDVYYGKTPWEINLVPDKNKQLVLIKDGYAPIHHELITKSGLRKYIRYDRKRCKFDVVGSILIIPFFALKSVRCRDFERPVYRFELTTVSARSQSRRPQPIRNIQYNPYLYQ